MKEHPTRTGYSAIAAAITLLCSAALTTAAQAQQSQPSEGAEAATAKTAKPADKNELSVVMVNATRVTSSLLQTPVAVSAMTQESLSREGITNMRGLSGTVPNLQIASGADSGVQINIRGVGSTNFTEIGDPAVGLHVAGLYSPRPQGALALMFDLEQVEVLRGPQGTLFGRNSTGGSVNIIPAKPEFGSSYGSAELDLGNYNKRQLNVVHNLAVNDKLALRATFSTVKRDGWIKQEQDFTDVNIPAQGFIGDGIPDVDQRRNVKVDKSRYYYNRDEWALRLAARAKLSPSLEWLISYERFQNNSAGEIALKDCEQAAGTRFACQGDPWAVKINVPGKTDMNMDTVRSALTWKLSPSTTLEYGMAYANQRRSQISDDDGGYHPLPSQVDIQLPLGHEGQKGVWPVRDETSITLGSKYKSTVHELQLKQQFDNVQLVSGLFWMHEKNAIDYAQEQLVTEPYGFATSQFYHQPDRQIDAKALFAQADWKFAPGWTATIGGRFSRDSKTDRGGQVYGGWDGATDAYYNGHYHPGTPGEPGFRAHNGRDLTEAMGPFAGVDAYKQWGDPAGNDHSESWKKFTYRLGLANQLTANDMVYTSLSTGYKAGGFGDKDDRCGDKTCVDGPAGPQYTFFPYKPETVTNFEFGYKGMMLNRRLSLSATAFFSIYKDMQVTGDYFASRVKIDAPCPQDTPTCDIITKYQTVNVGRVTIPGIELELDYKPWAGARLGGFFAYINSKMKDYPSFSDDWNCGVRRDAGAPACPEPYSGPNRELAGRQIYDITGNHLPNSPKYSFGLNFSQSFNLDNGYEVVPWVNLKWQDKMYFTLRNLDNPHISDGQKAFAKVDLSLKLNAPKLWHAELYVLNATNKMTKNSAGPWNGSVRAYYNDPRMIGVRFGLDY
ncbi:TonB-dependent receptor [Paucibacter sp. APW11]|uniref:TonB-dependent receptor n=1 Tax=Roseateles aquae TaxID=3077235 RepID=A0ABU3PC21_9BURK|nr:TonB-dependent receptor [Paucibacter sp. APW11]MDT9000119.1 TonB-dependent receptor [Paucibacter sp. APW11]